MSNHDEDPVATRHVSETASRGLVQLKISRRSSIEQNQNDNNPTKISISTVLHDELGEFKGLISGSGNSVNSAQDGHVFMMTLAGENLGANMAIRNAIMMISSPPATPNVNNNVQSVNNSTLQQSSCVARDPGVHLEIVSSREDVGSVDCVERIYKEPAGLKPGMMRGLDLNQERRPANAPRVRRRCLRSLFMESDSDIEDTGKPRRHGCRYKCEDNRERKG